MHIQRWKRGCYKYFKGDAVSLIKDIVSCKGDVNIPDSKHGFTPFHVLCVEGDYPQLIPYFLEAGADAHVENNSKITPYGQEETLLEKNICELINMDTMKL